MAREIKKSDCVWAVFSNFDDSATLHHCLMPVERKRKYTGELYPSNQYLCNRKRHVYNENEQALPPKELDLANTLYPNIACKSCLKIYNKLV